MKRIKIQQTILLLGVLLTTALIGVSCGEEGPQYKTPQISVVGDDIIDLKPGNTVDIKLQLNGDGGAKSVVVMKNGGFLKEFTVLPTSTEFIYTTDPLEGGLGEGDEVSYGFILTNKDKVDSPEAPFTIKVALYDKITVGSSDLYNLAIGTDGVVPSGTETKLIKGRNYYVPYYLTFEPGAKLTIEEGVQVYMNADADPAALPGIDIQGEADIVGTADAPVVFTSSNVLKADKNPAVGDWADFKITGSGASSNNGTIKYIRVEYGGNRMFRLVNVGSATAISHIQAFKSSGEGVMITDGNVNLKYIVATDCEGGSYRLGDAYQGQMQFVVSVNSQFFKDNDDLAIREDAKPVIANATVLGAGADLTSNTHGMRFRANAAPKVYNSIIAEFPRRGLRAGDNVTITDMNGAAVFAYSHIFKVKSDPYRDLAKSFATGFNNSDVEIPGIGVGAFVPSAEQASTFNPNSLGAFFESAPFVGAVKNAAGDWTKGWVKNPDGTVR